ncbi:MAG: sterol desaturase family protein [Bacteroidota bacterium]
MKEILDAQLSIESTLNYFVAGLLAYGLIELAYLYFFKKYDRMGDYKQNTINFVFVIGMNILISSLFGTISTGVLAILGYQHAIFTTDLSWHWWIYGLLVYEFFYWVQHWLAHKVRFFWCLHSPHHAPESMNMFVGFNHSFLETIFYMPFFMGLMPALLGVNPVIILVILVIDVTWGNLLHINESVMPGRYGLLEKILQTPSYHRVHHAQNVRYMDTNYNSMTLFWDWVFGTLQPLDDQEEVVYGITREVDASSFFDVQFGEYALLAKDIWAAPGLKDKCLYLVMPPGWSHTGEHQMASVLKQREKIVNSPA